MLTPKEIAVLKLVGEGLTQTEIASQLKISQPAVSGLYRNAMRKIAEAHEILALAAKLKVEHADDAGGKAP